MGIFPGSDENKQYLKPPPSTSWWLNHSVEHICQMGIWKHRLGQTGDRAGHFINSTVPLKLVISN